MPEVYTLRAPENFNYNNVHHRSSSAKKKQTRPVSSQKRTMNHLKPTDYQRIPSTDRLKGTSNQRPTTAVTKPKPSSAQAYRSLNETKPEMYHIKSIDTPKRSLTPNYTTVSKQRPTTVSTNSRQTFSIPYQPLNDRKAEMYHIRSNSVNKPLSTSRPQTTTKSQTRAKSPIIYQPLNNQKPEMYHINSNDNRQIPSRNEIPERPKSKSILSRSNTPTLQKVTTYTITPPDEEKFLQYIPRTPSPPMNLNKKNQYVTFNEIDRNDKYEVLERQRRNTSRTEYVPLYRSKALESIQRSMDRYRFRAS